MTTTVTRRPVRRAALPVLCLALAFPLGACSSSKKVSASSPPGTTTPASTSSAPTSPPTSAASSGPALTGEAAAVKTAFEKFFALDTPQAEAVTLLQNGPTFTAVIAEQAASPLSKGSSIQVTGVSGVTATKAAVTFTVLINGSPVLSGQGGWAVKEGGRWKVAATTFCTLVSLGGSMPTPCMDAKATALPG